MQGVGYRQAVAVSCRELGVQGFVRNLRDGRVEAALEGSPPAVEAVLQDMRKGPVGARVASVSTRPEPPVGEREFKILKTE